MTVSDERDRALATLENVQTVEDVASRTMSSKDAQRLRAVSEHLLESLSPMRPVIAAEYLQISEKTVRRWVKAGVLHSATTSPRLTLDPVEVVKVRGIVDEVRANAGNRDLLDAVWYRLADAQLLARDDLQESIAQMRRGDTVVKA